MPKLCHCLELAQIGTMERQHSIGKEGDSLSLDSAEGLQRFLSQHSIKTENFSLLSGGYTSTVFRASLGEQPTIIKHTRPRESFYPVYRKMDETRAQTEVEVLRRLHTLFPHNVPAIQAFFPQESVIVMSDVGADAQLGINYLLSGRAEPYHAQELGKFLGELKEATSDWKPFQTVEQPFEQVWTRGLEVEVASPEWGQRMRDYYLKSTTGFVWPDGHPKNVFFGDKGSPVRAIDFDCSHFADPDYMLPNFLGQIPVFTAMDHIILDQGIDFTKNMILAYNSASPISREQERKMVFYAGTQIIQRQDGKWLFNVCGGNDEEALKKKAFLFYFGRKVLTSADTFAKYIDIFQRDLMTWREK